MTNQTQTEEAIFLAAMQLATTESRMAYVQQACQGDTLALSARYRNR